MSIEISNLSKQFGSYITFDNINLNIKPGKLLAPSVSGKTTLLRVIVGLKTADSGWAII